MKKNILMIICEIYSLWRIDIQTKWQLFWHSFYFINFCYFLYILLIAEGYIPSKEIIYKNFQVINSIIYFYNPQKKVITHKLGCRIFTSQHSKENCSCMRKYFPIWLLELGSQQELNYNSGTKLRKESPEELTIKRLWLPLPSNRKH